MNFILLNVLNSNLFKTDDFNIVLSELTWNGSGSNMKWASYNITSKIHATKILSVSILDYSSWRDTDYINVTIGQTPDKIQIISNTTSFFATTSNIVVRVHYQAVS